MKTIQPKQISGNQRKWFIIDASDMILGRLATEVAVRLRGKQKVDFAPHVDNGDYVIVINCDKFHVTGNKLVSKLYRRHTGFLGGLISTPLEKMIVKKPGKPIEAAVSGMLPKNKLRGEMMKRLKMFSGADHTFTAQKPESIKL